MKALTVEWANVNWIYKYDRAANGEVCTPVVRLPEVDALLKEAVKMAVVIEAIANKHGFCGIETTAFLASVAAWRKGQEVK